MCHATQNQPLSVVSADDLKVVSLCADMGILHTIRLIDCAVWTVQILSYSACLDELRVGPRSMNCVDMRPARESHV